MSISELLLQNNYNLFANSITTTVLPAKQLLSAYASVDQSLNTTGSATKINFASTDIANTNYDTSTSIFTVPVNGNYRITAIINFYISISNTLGNNTWSVSGYIVKNGATIKQMTIGDLYGGGSIPNGYAINLEALLPLVAGDQISVSMSIPSATGVNIVQYSTFSNTYFIIQQQ